MPGIARQKRRHGRLVPGRAPQKTRHASPVPPLMRQKTRHTTPAPGCSALKTRHASRVPGRAPQKRKDSRPKQTRPWVTRGRGSVRDTPERVNPTCPPARVVLRAINVKGHPFRGIVEWLALPPVATHPRIANTSILLLVASYLLAATTTTLLACLPFGVSMISKLTLSPTLR